MRDLVAGIVAVLLLLAAASLATTLRSYRRRRQRARDSEGALGRVVIAELPTADDLVLVSHNHYDHLDVASLRALQRRHRPRIVTALGNARLMARHGIGGAVDLDWWQAVPIGELIVTCVPARHFSARGLSDRNRNLWSGFVISAPSGHVYFAGDTGWGAHFESIGARFDPIRLALLPIGSYRPRWFMQPAHIDPAQTVDAHHALGARRA